MIHIDPSLHASLKRHCRRRGTTMRKLVERLISEEIRRNGIAPVTRKSLPRLKKTTTTDEAYRAPPFWAGR